LTVSEFLVSLAVDLEASGKPSKLARDCRDYATIALGHELGRDEAAHHFRLLCRVAKRRARVARKSPGADNPSE
jgi:hypothetical protein